MVIIIIYYLNENWNITTTISWFQNGRKGGGGVNGDFNIVCIQWLNTLLKMFYICLFHMLLSTVDGEVATDSYRTESTNEERNQ